MLTISVQNRHNQQPLLKALPFLFVLSAAMLLVMAPSATADEVSGKYTDDPRCDLHGDQVAREELGDPAVFSTGQQIEHAATTTFDPACTATDNPDMANALVQITNLTGRSWHNLFYVGDPFTSFSNVDGIADAGVIDEENGLAFRIDSVGANRPLIFESIALNDVFEPGETWQFIVQDFVSAGGGPDSFFSVGFADASLAVIDNSAASIVYFIPEPATGLLLLAALACTIPGRSRI